MKQQKYKLPEKQIGEIPADRWGAVFRDSFIEMHDLIVSMIEERKPFREIQTRIAAYNILLDIVPKFDKSFDPEQYRFGVVELDERGPGGYRIRVCVICDEPVEFGHDTDKKWHHVGETENSDHTIQPLYYGKRK